MKKTNDRIRLEELAQHAMEQIFATSPETAAFHRGDWLDSEYYRRHLIETVLRGRLNNEVDAFALYKIGCKDNALAHMLAQHLAEAYGQEYQFLQDMEKFGVTAAAVDGIAPFHSTDRLIGYLYLSIGRDGPLPTMLWDWLQAWYSVRYNKVIAESAARAFGHDHVKGALRHIEHAESCNREAFAWVALQRAISGWGGTGKAEIYLRSFGELIHEYFEELRVATVPRPETGTAQAEST
ncbi:hypothetical protein [Paraburkholderia azotifigens]|uniref:Iron-containing redox enzyme family protein n=1 Tax=Paraburkholderia azotifigens TaxID=2057004 RepID=A0ABU9REZ0_9BURK